MPPCRRVEEAKEPALRAYDLLQAGEGPDSPATAIAGVRYAILLLGEGGPPFFRHSSTRWHSPLMYIT